MSEWPESGASVVAVQAQGVSQGPRRRLVFSFQLNSLEARLIICVRLAGLWANDVHYGWSARPGPSSLQGAV